MEALKSRKPERNGFINYIKTAKNLSRKDCIGVYRVLAELRLSETEVHLPMSKKIVDLIVRFFLFLWYVNKLLI